MQNPIRLLKDVRFYLFLALLGSAAFDLATTIPVIQYEANPLFLFALKGVFALVAVKLVLCTLVAWWIWNIRKLEDTRGFVYTTGVVLIILIQVIAGIGNLQVQKTVNPEGPGHETTEQKIHAMTSYAAFMVAFVFYPMLVAYAGFIIHKRLKVKQ